MKYFVTYLLSFIILFGCTSTLQKLKNKKPATKQTIVHSVQAEKEIELSTDPIKRTEPVLTLVSILGLVGGLMILSKLITPTKKQKNV